MNNIKDSKENEDYKIDFDRIAELIEKYKSEKTQGKIKGYTEEQTKVVFITPFFKALGWNTENRQNHNDSVSYEENIAGKRSDYGFSINGITKFYLEAKSLKEEDILFNTGYDKQAVNYAWLKSCSWAVLTNFETLAVYNADSGKAEWAFTLKSEEYLGENGKDKLKLLSKRGFEKGLLDSWALVNGKKPMKRPVDKQLLQDMIHFRETLSKDIKKNNPHVSEDDIDETVQRILDRLVFIRNAEDRGFEPKELKSNYNQWSQKEKGHLIKKVRELYQHYRDVYNSGLFGKDTKTIHISDQVDISNEALSEVIQGLYSPEGAIYSYNFAVLDADVLGKIYEQYLGNILKQTPKRAKLVESKTHRKEQGIYYTPSYIVDYIVKNTVGEYIKTHTPEEIRKVRILDPACGSGSFLIRAYKELEGYWSKYYEKNKDISKSVRTVKQTKFNPDMEGNEIEFYSTKTEILKNNIFGVDLDPKAVEIAQLNLLLQISERKQRLPILQNNIKVGNSLIDDPSISDRAFKWEEEFPEIMKEGGFDIVIGNPPYIRNTELSKIEKEFFVEKFICAYEQYDIFILFFEIGIKLLKNGGYLSFITSNKFIASEYGKKLRHLILNSCKIRNLLDLSHLRVFKDASTYPSLIGLQKEFVERIRIDNFVKFQKIERIEDIGSDINAIKVKQSNFEGEDNKFLKEFGDKKIELIKKIENESLRIKDVFTCQRGSPKNKIELANTRTKDSLLCIEPKNIDKYFFQTSDNKFVVSNLQNKILSKEKILLPRTVLYLKAAYNEGNSFIMDRIYYLIPKDAEKINLKFVVGLLNSKLIDFFYKINFSSTHVGGGYLDLRGSQIEQLPIRIPENDEQETVAKLVDKAMLLKKQMREMESKKTDKRNSLELESYSTNSEINKLIYKIYNLTNKEKDVVEEFFT